MKHFGKSLLASTAAITFFGAAQAADLPVYDKAPPAPLAPASCASAEQFFVTACPLSYYGITVYGTVDIGGGYETHGTPLNKNIATGVEELVQKNSNRPLWLLTPGGLSQSNIGIKGVETITSGLNFVFDLNFGFDPYTMTAANGPKSLLDNNGVPLASQSSNADSSRAGQFYNSVGYAGISSPTYGTLTVGRQNTLELDGVNAYDPMGGSYAFSVIGWQGTAVGGGDTEDARVSTAVKYRADVGDHLFRVGAMAQIGGYNQNNAAQGEYAAQIGKDLDFGASGKLSLDAIWNYDKGAVKAASLAAGSAAFAANPDTLGATISDDQSGMLLAKYTYKQLRVYGGYEFISFANPSTPLTQSFNNIAGIPVLFANISQTGFVHDEHLQIMWTGARYAFTDAVDAGVAYYHYDQNSFGKTFCGDNSASTCAGTLDAFSVDVDWKFAKKFDAYAGIMYSRVHDGLANGYLFTNNFAPTAGLRFQF
ncbi:porin [Bradyrhizobium sp. dw_78]|uniref:porin n=1 Tax=Bradyrhizobium sp. dw_78 TaxID=2719793 RepID=UPI001BD1F351|nr:porin [Bradyrhizobium sp. dw_78]